MTEIYAGSTRLTGAYGEYMARVRGDNVELDGNIHISTSERKEYTAAINSLATQGAVSTDEAQRYIALLSSPCAESYILDPLYIALYEKLTSFIEGKEFEGLKDKDPKKQAIVALQLDLFYRISLRYERKQPNVAAFVAAEVPSTPYPVGDTVQGKARRVSLSCEEEPHDRVETMEKEEPTYVPRPVPLDGLVSENFIQTDMRLPSDYAPKKKSPVSQASVKEPPKKARAIPIDLGGLDPLF